MADPRAQLANLLAKASAKSEPEMVTLTQFIHPDGTVYWAKKARTPNCVTRHAMTRQVIKGSAEDK